MVASHDLYQDLQVSEEEIKTRRAQEPQLDELLDDYMDIDNQILAGESISAGDVSDDDATRELKSRRVELKNRIAEHLRNSG